MNYIKKVNFQDIVTVTENFNDLYCIGREDREACIKQFFQQVISLL